MSFESSIRSESPPRGSNVSIKSPLRSQHFLFKIPIYTLFCISIKNPHPRRIKSLIKWPAVKLFGEVFVF